MAACGSIYKAAGAPSMEGAQAGYCRTCGIEASGVAFKQWVRPTFTDHDKLHPGEIICHACQFCFTDQNTELSARVGKPNPQRMRNYSHFVKDGEWVPLSKGNKRRMKELLLDDPDVAVIADSGQKHLIFRAVVGWWQFEEMKMRPFPEELLRVLSIVEPAYCGGFSKAELQTGRYIQSTIQTFGLSAWRDMEAELKPLRGTKQIALGLFLAQKDEEEDDTRRDSREPVDTGVDGNIGELQGKVRAEHLGTIRRSNQKRGVHVESPTLF